VSGNISAKALYHNNASIKSESGAITVGAMHGAAFAFFLISRTIMGWLMGSRREGGCAHAGGRAGRAGRGRPATFQSVFVCNATRIFLFTILFGGGNA
jgi:hypothetical protein